ncbi:hypothetical protein ACFE04_022075 [Oxalis oulophora]
MASSSASLNDSDKHVNEQHMDMERKKIRKAKDKNKKRKQSNNKEDSTPNPEPQPQTEYKPTGLPEFHISVFKDLASSDLSARHVAAESLVKELQDVQNAYDKLEDKAEFETSLKLEAEKDDGLNDCAPSVRYALRRLIRGISSSRECARQGFALGLTLLVGAVPSIRIDSLLKLIVDLLEYSSSMKGQEAKDNLFGRLFAYGALSRSGRLVKEWKSDKNTPYVKEFTAALITLATKKRYLQEPAVSIILDLCEKFPTEVLLEHVLEAPGIQEWFEEATSVGNPDALLLALKIREKLAVDSTKFGKLLPNPFSPSTLFAADHLSSLVNCLKESTFCQPRVHSVWPVLVNLLLPDVISQAEDPTAVTNSLKKHKKNRKTNSSDEEIAKNIQSFCEIVIDGSLILSSHDRKHLAFDILLLLLPRLPASFIPDVLSYKLVQCLMDILSKNDSWLFKVANHVMKELLDWVKNDDVRRVAIIVALQKHSNGKFDSNRKTKAVKDMMADFKTEAGCLLFVQSSIKLFLDEDYSSEGSSDQSQSTTDDNSEIGSLEDKDSGSASPNSDSLKIWVVEYLPSILKYLKLDPEAKFCVQKEILKFLAVQGLFSSSLGSEVTSFELEEKFRWPKTATSSAMCSMCIEQLQVLLAGAQKSDGTHIFANGTEPNDLGAYFMRFLGTLRNIPSVSLFRTLSDDEEKAFKDLQEVEARLLREERKCGMSITGHKIHAMRNLLMQLLLQMLLRPGEFSDAAFELMICCKKSFELSDLLNTSADGEEEDDDEQPDLMDVLVDTLLSLLPQSSASMRFSIEQVFKFFCDNITDDGLLRMLRVIKKDIKPPRHRVADSDDEDDDDEEEDLLGIEEEDEGLNEVTETRETAESDEHTDDSEAVIGAGESGNVSDGSDDTSNGSDASDDESDGGMDDEAMFRMDTYLARIFQEKRNQAGSETAQAQLVQFKLRVLSLLEIFMHENPAKPQVLTAFANLTQAYVIANTAEGNEQLAQRIWGILQKKIFKAKDFPKGEGLQLSVLEALLEKNLKLASKPFKGKKLIKPTKKQQSNSRDRHKMNLTLAQNSTFWILKLIDSRNFSESELQKVLEIFQSMLVGYLNNKKSQIKSGFVKEIFRRRVWVGRGVFDFLMEKCVAAKLEYRRVEALELVIDILKLMVPPSADESSRKKTLKSHLEKIAILVKELVTNMPKKHARVVDVRKFCSKVFQMISNNKLTKPFLKQLGADARAQCESQLGQAFLELKKSES